MTNKLDCPTPEANSTPLPAKQSDSPLISHSIERSSTLKERLARAGATNRPASSPSTPSRYAIGRDVDKPNADTTDEREEERLSKFLRSPSIRTPTKTSTNSHPTTPSSNSRNNGSYTPLFPSPSVVSFVLSLSIRFGVLSFIFMYRLLLSRDRLRHLLIVPHNFAPTACLASVLLHPPISIAATGPRQPSLKAVATFRK